MSGNVEEIRKEQGKGRFSLTFKGEESKLLDALGDKIITHEIVVPEKTYTDGSTQVILKIQPEVSAREIIGIANDLVEIESFSKSLPSMDEIFINAVKQSNGNEE